MKKITHIERIKAVLEGKTVDRPPFVAWGPHLNLEDKHVGDFTKAVIAYQNQHQFDVLKVMQNGLYDTEDYGQVIADTEDCDDACYLKTIRPAFTSLDDWKNITKKDIHKGAFGREMEIIKILCDYYKDEVPVLPTIFGPYRMLTQLIGYAPTNPMAYGGKPAFVGDEIMPYIHEHEEEYFHVMDVITEQVIDLMNGFLDVGAAGFFYCPGGTYVDNSCTEEDYLKYIRPYDQKALEAVYDRSWFTMLHICGMPAMYIEHMLDLPAHALNWEDCSPLNPSLEEVRAKTDKVLMGGIDRNKDFFGAKRIDVKATLKKKAVEALRQSGPKTIVAVGCESSRKITPRFVVWREVMDEMADASAE